MKRFSLSLKKESSSGSRDIWLAIYSDLMTNLMLFYLLMFGMTMMPDDMRKKAVEGLEKKFKPQMTENKVKQIIQQVNEEESMRRLQHYAEMSIDLKKYAKVQVDEQRIKIILRTPLLFDVGESALKPEGKNVIREVGRIIAVLEKPMVVEGHTDDTPITSGQYQSNWDLSMDRALSVTRCLQQNGIKPNYLSGAGHGEWKPSYPNDTELGRQLNRRVEIHILRETSE